ncbi:MAG: hypothetical protein V1656_01030 [Candidatus Jorgensenbacteria bacterium]
MRTLLYFFAKILGFPINPRTNRAVLAMVKKIGELGGLRFSVRIEKDGWTAECKNLDGIITGNTNPTPSIYEIDQYIKDAIFSAFSIPPYLCDEKMIVGPLDNLERKMKPIEQLNFLYQKQFLPA